MAFTPSWCGVHRRPPTTPPSTTRSWPLMKVEFVGGQEHRSLGDVVGPAGARDRLHRGHDLRRLGVAVGLVGLHAQRLGEDAGGDAARRDRVAAHVLLAELHGGADRQVVHRGLGRAVDHRGRVAGAAAGDAAVVDDAARTLLHHDRRGVLHAEHDRAHQGRHRRVEALDRDRLDAADRRRPAGIVEQAVEPAPFGQAGLEHRLHVGFLGGVGLDEQAIVLAEPRLERPAELLAPAGRQDLGALRDEDLDGAPADAAGRAGDDGDLAVELAHGCLPFSRPG